MLGHVNNAAWIAWLQDVATAHWYAAAPPEWADRWIWVVVRHEVDYLRALKQGESVVARTWFPAKPEGARFVRMIEFVGADDGPAPEKPYCRARTVWAMLDADTMRPQRIPPEVKARFGW